MPLSAVVERLRAHGPGAALRALAPRRVDELLYGIDASTPLPALEFPADVDVQRYHQPTAGDAAIDRRLDGRRACFVARVDGRIAHQSWLHYDTVLPSLFGYGRTPVIGDCATAVEFRGRHLYPHMLAHIVREVRATAKGQAAETSGTVHVLVSPDNSASIRGIERAGFRLIARLRGVRVGPFVIRQPLRADSSVPSSRSATTRPGST